MKLVKPSDFCGRSGCQDETVVCLAIVRNHKGRQICGPASQFLLMDKNHNPIVPYELKTEYQFVSWVTRCAECYSNDVERHNQRLAN